jgi:ChrR Cupin-like domain
VGAANGERLVPAALPECITRLLGEPITCAKVWHTNPPSASGARHGLVLRGSWHYLEHNWIATEGSYVFEPPGETHTLVVPNDVQEMITLFHITGCMIYVDPRGKQTGYEDVFTKITMCRQHYGENGLGAKFVEQFIR